MRPNEKNNINNINNIFSPRGVMLNKQIKQFNKTKNINTNQVDNINNSKKYKIILLLLLIIVTTIILLLLY